MAESTESRSLRGGDPGPLPGGTPADKREFERLLTPLLDSLYGVALRMTRNAADAEDLVQNTVVKAFRFFPRFEGGTTFKAWTLWVMTSIWKSTAR